MARRAEAVEVELVPDEAQQQGEAPTSPGTTAGAGRRVAARWQALARRTRVLVGAVTVAAVVVPLGTVAVLDAAADRERAATLPGMPGGVADLSVAPDPGWEIATDDGVLRTLPGGGILTRDGRDVLAVDAATGDERWRHTLGMLAECGPGDGTDPADSAEPVVCLAGPPDRRTVTVLDVDGTVVGTRDLGAVESPGTQITGVGSVEGYGDQQSRRRLPAVWPAADGALMVREPGHGFIQPADADEARRDLDELRSEDLPELRVVDALSGEVRGSATPSLRTTADLAGCEDSSGGWLVDLQQPYTEVSGGLASLSVCAAQTVLTADGEQVAGVPPAALWHTWGQDGGLVVETESGATVVRDDGTHDLPGVPLPVEADADPSDTVVVTAPDGTAAGAAPDGTRRWTSSVEVDRSNPFPYARADGAVLLPDADGDLVALDLATGEERWHSDDVLPGADESHRWVVGALTDGAHVVLGIRRDDGYDLVALDVGSGRTVWKSGAEGLPLTDLVALDGHPVAVLQDVGPSVRVGGDNEEGVATSDTVLRGLATG